MWYANHERELGTQCRLPEDSAINSIANARTDVSPSPMLGDALVRSMVNREQTSPQKARGKDQHHNLREHLVCH